MALNLRGKKDIIGLLKRREYQHSVSAMKILILASQNPYSPTDGGKSSIYFPVKYLAKNFDVGLFFFYDKEYPAETVGHFKDIGVKAFPFRLNTRDSFLGIVKNLFEEEPYKVKKYHNRSAEKYLAEVIKKFAPDLVQSYQVHMAHYGLRIKQKFSIPAVLREQNIEHLLVKQYASLQKNSILKMVSYWQYHKMRVYEQAIWKKFDKVVFISKNDLSIAQKDSNGERGKYSSIQDGIEVSERIEKNIVKKRNSIVFAGNLNIIQNRLSVTWFIRNVWLMIKQKVVDSHLYLYGGGEEILYRESGMTKEDLLAIDIVPMGFVEDIDGEIMKHEIFISPSIIGSGLRLKVLRALSLGMPVVCTEIDAVGIDYLQNGVNAIVVNGADAFANAVLSLFDDETLCDSLGENAKKMVEEYYTWEEYTERMVSEYSLLAPKVK